MTQRFKAKQFVKLALVLGLFFVVVGCLKKFENKPVVIEKKEEVKIEEKKSEVVENKVNDENQEVDTSDWLTYGNEELGVEMKHPKEWNVEYDDLNKKIKFINPKYFVKYLDLGYISYFTISRIIINDGFETYVDKEIKEINIATSPFGSSETTENSPKLEKKQINNNDAVIIGPYSDLEGTFSYIDIIIKKDNNSIIYLSGHNVDTDVSDFNVSKEFYSSIVVKK